MRRVDGEEKADSRLAMAAMALLDVALEVSCSPEGGRAERVGFCGATGLG